MAREAPSWEEGKMDSPEAGPSLSALPRTKPFRLLASEAALPSSPPELLSHRLAVLTGGLRDLPAHPACYACVDYDLLSKEEQRLFRLCSLFVGGYTLKVQTSQSFRLIYHP